MLSSNQTLKDIRKLLTIVYYTNAIFLFKSSKWWLVEAVTHKYLFTSIQLNK